MSEPLETRAAPAADAAAVSDPVPSDATEASEASFRTATFATG